MLGAGGSVGAAGAVAWSRVLVRAQGAAPSPAAMTPSIQAA